MVITRIDHRPERHARRRMALPRWLMLLPLALAMLLGGIEMLATPERVAAVAAAQLGHPAE